ncbi:hypothetical protein [Planctopirus hydrillae]|uniref:Uncharacterized protein n=1 Tax=Planctopirus hydrillae TaxID=1841610 RepID=A0A1C3E790_9PLAN|nr:hypothetical protein [Planctopirus hydrillae]ODA29091.1 hypothetical protein A6X21_09760 [Planctopirus hydrillae]
MDTDTEPDPQVRVQRHVYDFNDLAGGLAQRLTTIMDAPAGCHYLNPAVSVSCSQPTPAFFAKVKQEQARWCRIASQTFRKRERRSAKSWISHERITNKYARFLDRAACFTGFLFIDGKVSSLQQLARSLNLTDRDVRAT